MVQSPFRYKKPNNKRPFSDGPDPSQRTTIWIGGETFIGEGAASSSSSFIANTFRSALNPFGSRRDLQPEPDENDARDVEAAKEDDVEKSTTSSTEDIDDDENDTRAPWFSSSFETKNIPSNSETKNIRRSLRANPNSTNGRRRRSRIKSVVRSLSPRRESRKREGALLCPQSNNDGSANTTPLADIPPIPPPNIDRPRSVSIGGSTIIGEQRTFERPSRQTFSALPSTPESTDSERNGRSCRKRPSSLEIPPRSLTLSSIDSDTVEHIGDVVEGSHEDTEDDEEVGRQDQRSVRKISSAPPLQSRRAFESGTSNSSYGLHTTVDGIKRRRLSKRARTRLTMREVNSHIQPGRQPNLEARPVRLEEKLKMITLPKAIDFFSRVEMKLIAVNVSVSTLITAIVLCACPPSVQATLMKAGQALGVLGAFMSFSLVFRTGTCYRRWWEGRSMWGRMTAACINLSHQGRTWFGDEDLVDRFLTLCILYPYAVKAVLRGKQLTDESEEGPRFLHSGMLNDADLGLIMRNGMPPFVCLGIMRRTLYEAFKEDNGCHLPSSMISGAFLSMEDVLKELLATFGACLKINSTRMPASYTLFMRTFVIFFFILASVSWAPSLGWLTPVITGWMVFLINTIIVIGDQMIRPFDMQWAGLPLQKYCVIIEGEVMNVSRRHADIDCLFQLGVA